MGAEPEKASGKECTPVGSSPSDCNECSLLQRDKARMIGRETSASRERGIHQHDVNVTDVCACMSQVKENKP